MTLCPLPDVRGISFAAPLDVVTKRDAEGTTMNPISFMGTSGEVKRTMEKYGITRAD